MNVQELIDQLLNISIFGIAIKQPLIFLVKSVGLYIIAQSIITFVKFLFHRSLKRKGKLFIDETNVGFIQRIVVYGIYIFFVAIFLSFIPGMEKVSNSILAGAGILTMAIGFASQDALSNIIGGLFIVFAKPFRIGDIIKVDEVVQGTVSEITLRHTIIRSLENRMIIIPNNKMNTSIIINSTIGEQDTCSFVEVGVSYEVNLNHAIDVMREEVMKHPLLIDRRTTEEQAALAPQVVIRVISLGDSSITLKAWAWAATTGNAFTMKCDLLKAIKERFDKEQIEIPYPYYNNVITQSK